MRRSNLLKIGLGVLTMSVMAACGTAAPASTSAPAAQPTAAPSATSAPTASDATATTAATVAPTATSADAQAATPAATDAMTATAAVTTATTTSGSIAVFKIDPGKTTATFTLTEVLLGKDNTVVGATSKVSGVISVTMDQPANSQIGTIQIDATDFKTDSNMRNGMIQRSILKTSQYQYVSFQATAIDGLPAKVNAGDQVPVKITGNLTVLGQTRPVTFAGTVTMKSDNEIDGTLAATIARADFGLTIPKVPSVASASDNVWLTLQFVATKQ
ncbi:MAG: YceI family protein [Chloroflexi bacterium]|nr:YceI family protein [Chloroflexota bacterium]MCL5274449.1 YceI family protein [Chloroflexota bacterium]